MAYRCKTNVDFEKFTRDLGDVPFHICEIFHDVDDIVWAQQHIFSHYSDVIMDAIASQITSLTIVYSTVYSDADQRKHQSSASLAFVRRIHRGSVNSPHKWPVTWKMCLFDDVIKHYYWYASFSSLKPSALYERTVTKDDPTEKWEAEQIFPW